MLENAYAIIMAGGKGERFWPLSTSSQPKQLLALVGDKPMIALTMDYLDGLIPPERTFVITNASLVDAVQDALPQLPLANIIGEPMGRDTAAAVALGCALVKAQDPDGVFCVLTADHIIKDIDIFQDTLREGLTLAGEDDLLVTMGIDPAFPSTGFGYIEAGDTMDTPGSVEFRKAIRFVEKPDTETATRYLSTGNYYWNSGMFLWSVRSLEAAFRKHFSELAELCDRLVPAIKAKRLGDELSEAYPGLTRISIDFAVMEKADNIAMARGVFRWDDVGSWPALENHFEPDGAGNTVVGLCQALDASQNVVVSHERLTALIGVDNLVVVQAPGATLICSKDRAQDIKQIVRRMAESGEHDHLL